MGEIKRERAGDQVSLIESVSDCARKREKARARDGQIEREGKKEGQRERLSYR